jgi:hypothetical protein
MAMNSNPRAHQGNGLADTVMRLWLNIQEKLVMDCFLFGCMLTPNPIIMVHCAEKKAMIHNDATKQLIEKIDS